MCLCAFLGIGLGNSAPGFDGITIRPPAGRASCFFLFFFFKFDSFPVVCVYWSAGRIVCIPPPPSLSEWEEDQQLQLEQHKSQGEGEKKEQQQPSDGGGGGGGCSGTEATSPSRITIAEIPPVSEVDARNALLGLVTEHCCWGRSAARHMSIGKILSSSAFHVKTT